MGEGTGELEPFEPSWIDAELARREPDYTKPLFISPTDMQITGEKVLPERPRARIVMVGCFDADGVPFYWQFDLAGQAIAMLSAHNNDVLLWGWSREELKKVYRIAKELRDKEKKQ